MNTPAVDWSVTRGAFVTNGRLYYGRSDGTFRVRSFDGSSLGAESTIDLHGLNSSHFPLANVTGMFLDQGRLYYTVAGNSNLFYRYFSPSWDMTGAQTFTVNSSAEFDWGTVAGMTMVDGNIYVGRANGNLDRIGFSNRLPVGGSRTTVSGPGSTGGTGAAGGCSSSRSGPGSVRRQSTRRRPAAGSMASAARTVRAGVAGRRFARSPRPGHRRSAPGGSCRHRG